MQNIKDIKLQIKANKKGFLHINTKTNISLYLTNSSAIRFEKTRDLSLLLSSSTPSPCDAVSPLCFSLCNKLRYRAKLNMPEQVPYTYPFTLSPAQCTVFPDPHRPQHLHCFTQVWQYGNWEVVQSANYSPCRSLPCVAINYAAKS